MGTLNTEVTKRINLILFYCPIFHYTNFQLCYIFYYYYFLNAATENLDQKYLSMAD